MRLGQLRMVAVCSILVMGTVIAPMVQTPSRPTDFAGEDPANSAHLDAALNVFKDHVESPVEVASGSEPAIAPLHPVSALQVAPAGLLDGVLNGLGNLLKGIAAIFEFFRLAIDRWLLFVSTLGG